MKSILILGSGFVVGPLVDYLHRKSENHLIIASNDLNQARSNYQ